MTMVKLHYFDLHESPVQEEGNYERFQMTWFLKNDSPPSGVPEDDIFSIATGDLIAVEELFTGAGELEGVRAVGPLDDSGQRFVLMPVGIEQMEWPQEILDWAGNNTSKPSLRELYQDILNEIFDATAGCTLEDMVDDVDEFWANPIVANRTDNPDLEEWEIPLSGCTLKPKLHVSSSERT